MIVSMLKYASITLALAVCASAETIRKRGATQIPLGDFHNANADMQWYANISVGNPPQNFTVIVDTGSNYLILPRNNCTGCSTTGRSFDPSKSSTFTAQPYTPQSMGYSTAGTTRPTNVTTNLQGLIVSDTVSIGGLSVANQTFLLFDVGPGAELTFPVDGILGVPPVPASSHSPAGYGAPLFFRLNETGQLSAAEFALQLNSSSSKDQTSGGELTLGGTDSSKYVGDIKYVSLNRTIADSFGEWIVYLANSSVNGNSTLADAVLPKKELGQVALIDCGTAYIQTPDFASAQAMYAAISPDIKQIDPAGAWGASCDTMSKLRPNISFVLTDDAGSRVTVDVDPASFNLGPYPGLNDTCQGVLVNALQPVYDPVNYWILGSPMIKKYYTAWDTGALRLGFAALSDSEQSGNPSGTNQTASGSGTATTAAPTATGGPTHGSSGTVARASSMGALIALLIGHMLL